MKVLFLAAEADPYIKVGGLGDVASALPQAILNLTTGNPEAVAIRLAIPYHNQIKSRYHFDQPVASFVIPYLNSVKKVDIYETRLNQLPVYLVDGDLISEAETVYSPDGAYDTRKYAFFVVAALSMLAQLHWMPDVVHCNDWHTAIAPAVMRQLGKSMPAFKKTKSVLTIHNLPFMGAPVRDLMKDFYISAPSDETLPDWAKDLPLPLGLSTADRITFVSPSYAEEVLTEPFGCGLDEYLSAREEKISGILNGIDTQLWNPETDALLTRRYTINSLVDKQTNKETLFRETGLSPQNIDTPLLALIGRLDRQKGIDIAISALKRCLDLPWSLVLLGTGSSEIEREIAQFTEEHPGRIVSFFRFDNELAHKIYAGADLLLMPSRYEPCGLAQMIAMRYGTPVLASAVGGLRDTIVSEGPADDRDGFLFQPPSRKAMVGALRDALAAYAEPTSWERYQVNAMRKDFSWDNSSHDYFTLYQSILESQSHG